MSRTSKASSNLAAATITAEWWPQWYQQQQKNILLFWFGVGCCYSVLSTMGKSCKHGVCVFVIGTHNSWNIHHISIIWWIHWCELPVPPHQQANFPTKRQLFFQMDTFFFFFSLAAQQHHDTQSGFKFKLGSFYLILCHFSYSFLQKKTEKRWKCKTFKY